MKDIDAAVERLKKRGATDIILFGQSLGGNMALGYAANRSGLKGIIVTAAGHNPGIFSILVPDIGKAFKHAQQLVESGKGDIRMTFPDFNDTGVFSVRATPKTYVSFFDPTGPANMSLSASKVSIPVLWISGDADQSQRAIPPMFAHLPKHALTRHVTLKGATHRGTPIASQAVALQWLKELVATK